MGRITGRIYFGILAGLFIFALVGVIHNHYAQQSDLVWEDDNHVVLPYCQTEDSVDCYWDAEKQGNGVGRSFIDLDGYTYYLGEK